MHETETETTSTPHDTNILTWKPSKGKNHGGKPYPQSDDTTAYSKCVQMGSAHAKRITT